MTTHRLLEGERIGEMLANELLNDPVTLAIAVVVDRIRGLSREDRDDLFELTDALKTAETEEEYEAAARGMREILGQQGGQVRALEPAEPCDELKQWMDTVGQRIRSLREQAGLTQEQLSERSGLPQSHISRLETGRHSPSAATLERIAAALGIRASQIDPSL